MASAAATKDNRIAIELEQARDLRGQLAGLGSRDKEEIAFEVLRPGTSIVTLWSMETGEEIKLPDYMAGSALNKRSRKSRSGWMFTALENNAPEPIEGTIHCFLHPDAPEADVVRSLGLMASCTANALANNYSKTSHAQRRHKAEWAQYQDEMQRAEADANREEQRAMQQAMVKVAESVTKSKSA